MEQKEKKIRPTAEEKDKNDSKKYNFYRKPSIKKKVPEVKHTLTSYKRMLKANPLLKNDIEVNDLISKQIPSSMNSQNKVENTCKSFQTEKQSLQPNFNAGKPLIAKVQRTQSLKNPSKLLIRPTKNGGTSIISGSKQLLGKNMISTNISRESTIDFNGATSKLLCSTPLDNNNSKTIQTTKNRIKNSNNVVIGKIGKESSTSSKSIPDRTDNFNNPRKTKSMRRSLSAQHFERKKVGTVEINQKNCFTQVKVTQSLEDVSNIKPDTVHDISPIPEGSTESTMMFKTPSAYERRSIVKFTPKSGFSTRRSLYHPSTSLPSLYDLQKRLNDWLVKRGKSLSSFHHLKCFETQNEKTEIVDEENKENIEVDQDLDKGSYEDLKINNTNCIPPNTIGSADTSNSNVPNEENAESIAKAALGDLYKLIQEGYPGLQCEGWLELIRQKFKKLEEEPQYWECRAAIEQSRGNISRAVDCYKTAIVQGAEIQSVDESLDILLQKFSLLNISPKNIENEKSTKERARIVRDARNVFKSSIIQFAVQEMKLKKNGKIDEKKFVATPVRRSTRLSRSAYASTPGVKICSSLQELNISDKEVLDFKKNKALV